MDLFGVIHQSLHERYHKRGGFFGIRNQGQAKVLAILQELSPMSQKDLVAQLDMKPQSASELIKKLEKKGLLTREKSTEDKRVYIVSITEAGLAIFKDNDGMQVFSMETFTEDEKEQFIYLLDKLNNEIRPTLTHKPRIPRPRGERPARPERPERPRRK